MEQKPTIRKQIGSDVEHSGATPAAENLESLRITPRYSQPNQMTWLRPWILAILLVPIGIGVGWLALPPTRSDAVTERDEARNQRTISADESCKKVTQLISELPTTKEEIDKTTSQIQAEVDRIEELTAKGSISGHGAFELGRAYDAFSKARVGLAAKVEAFIKRDSIKASPSQEPGSLSSKDGTEFDIAIGPGQNLLDAVEQYDAACRQCLTTFADRGEASEPSWGK